MSAHLVAVAQLASTVPNSDLLRWLRPGSESFRLYQNLSANGVKVVEGETPRILLTAEPTAEGWILGVRDNGIGVAPSDAEEIFKPFRRLHAAPRFAGTGIGLTICRKAVERHGGRIWVESEPGKGAHFRFTLGRADVDESLG